MTEVPLSIPIPAAPAPDWGVLRRRVAALTAPVTTWRAERRLAAEQRRLEPPPRRPDYLEHAAMMREMRRL